MNVRLARFVVHVGPAVVLMACITACEKSRILASAPARGGLPPTPSIAPSPTTEPGAVAPSTQRGIDMDRLVEVAFPGYVLRARQLSKPGLGYHYTLQRPPGAGPLIVTVGVFDSADQALQAAALSHRLMPQKPQPLEGFGDEAWAWAQPRACAIRIRWGGLLIRIGGAMPLTDLEGFAKSLQSYLETRPATWPTAGGFPRLGVSGLPSHIAPGAWTELHLRVEGAAPAEHFVTGVWASDGRVLPRGEGVYGFKAPSRAGAVTVRCYAVFDDNRVAVDSRQVDVNQGR